VEKLSRRATRQARGRPALPPRRFPPPWSVEELDACFVVRDHNGQALAYIYYDWRRCEDLSLKLPKMPSPMGAKREQAGMSKPTTVAACRRACSWRVAAEAPLFGLVMVLQRNHQSLHRPQRPQRDNEDQWQPKRRMHPIRWLKQNLGHQRGTDDDRAGQEYDEYGRTVAGIDKAVIEPADLAARPQRQEARKQLAVAAARTAAAEASVNRS